MKLKTNRPLFIGLLASAAIALCIHPITRVSAKWNLDQLFRRNPALAIFGGATVPPSALVTNPRSGAIAAVTDQDSIPLSNKFGAANSVGLADSGDAILSFSQTALFRWQSSDGSRTRLLQSSDPAPEVPGSLIDIVGAPAYNASGHFVAVNNYVALGQPAMRQLLVYDNAGFHALAKRGDIAPDSGGQTFINFNVTRINDLDQVAFIGNLGTTAAVSSGVYTASVSGSPVKISVVGDAAPGGGTFSGAYTLIGMNSSGDVAFAANVQNGPTNLTLFIKNASGLHKVAAVGDAATGTAGTFSSITANTAFFNDNGDLAFGANVSGAAPVTQGIWVGNAAGANAKLVVNTDATGTTLNGTYSAFAVNGLNNSGKVLFQGNVSGGTSAFGLFLKDLSSPAQVIISRGQSVPGGTTETFNTITQAQLNHNGQVAMQAGLTSGPATTGVFLGSGTAAPTKIMLQNETTPAGGTFIGTTILGSALRINNLNQVAFQADVSGINGGGVFLFTPGSGLRSIVTSDDDLPAGANTVLRTFAAAGSNDRVVFLASKAGGRWGFFTKALPPNGGSVTALVSEGDAAPGISGAIWNLPSNNFPTINNQNEALFTAQVVGGGAATTIVFTHKPGIGLRKVAANGDAVPGGGTFVSPSIGGTTLTRINNSGQVAFFSNVNGGGGQAGVFIATAGGPIAAVARNGAAAFAGNLSGLSNTLSLNDAGKVAFRAVSGTTDALFIGDGVSAAAKVIAKGDAVPTGGIVNVTPARFQLNNNGQLVYVATLSGGTAAKGIFVSTVGGAPQIIALVGDAAPGAGAGATFSDFGDPDIEINSSGQVAFRGALNGSTGTAGYFVGGIGVAPSARLVEGQSLPDAGSVTTISTSLNQFVGDFFSLTDSGELGMFFTGDSNLNRSYIADSAGNLRPFVVNGQQALDGSGTFPALFQNVGVNSQGRFFESGWVIGGTARTAVFINADDPSLSLSTNKLDFGKVSLSTSTTQTLTVSHAGSIAALPFRITNAAISGTNAGDYSITSDNCTNVDVNTGGSCTITVQLNTAEVGTRTANLTLNSNVFDSPHTVTLTGIGKIGNAYEVTNTNDSGAGSLRQALDDANANAGTDTVVFNIPGTGVQTIAPQSSLPGLNSPVFIDGTTQPGFAGQPIVEINGTAAGTCFYIPSSSNGNTIRGLVMNRCGGHGMQIDSGNNTIKGNYIGTNATGTGAAPVTFSGIFLGGNNNQIGGTTPADRNVISGNGHQGIAVTGSNNTIQGNYVGTDVTGTSALGGGNVAIFQGGSNNLVGGTVGTSQGVCTGACNLLSGNNGSAGIGTGGGGTNNTFQGNYIGVNLTGTAAIPNNAGGIRLGGVSGNHIIGNLVSGNNGTGISLFDSGNPTSNNDIRGNFIGTNSAGTAAIPNTGGGIEMHTAATGNVIGGTTPADRNLVSGNSGDGIGFSNLSGVPTGNIVKGNYIGTNKDGNAILPNTGQGVGLYGAVNNFIGGPNPGEANLISGNNANGVNMSSRSPGSGQPPAGSTGNHVEGNLIGTDITGTIALRNNANGISIASSSGNFIGGMTVGSRNVISGNTQAGISFSNSGPSDPTGANNNIVRGNYIGTKADGNSALANGNSGIAIASFSTGNIIGGDDAADGSTDGVVRARNLISGNNNDGIVAGNGNGQSSNTVIQGNYIGVNVSGTAAIPNNFSGISVSGVSNTQIGGTSAGAGNLISGNNQNGINMNESNIAAGQPLLPVTNTHIEGNFIGTNAAGTASIRNQQTGIGISGTNSSNNYVGGSVPAARNLIGANGGNAITLNPHADGNFVLGNWIGVDINGTTALVTNIGGVITYGNGGGVIISGSSNNQIGGPTAAERNVIAGNNCQAVNILNNLTGGVLTQASNNRIQGNYIGLNAAGSDMVIDPTNGSKFGNKCSGIFIAGATNNLVGGTAPGQGNVIGGSAHQGVVVSNNNGVVGSANTIQGNLIGSNVAMTLALPNGIGVNLISGASNNLVGGDDLADGSADGNVAAANRIFGSTGDGIQVQSVFSGGNLLATGNIIQGNLIGGSTLLRNGSNGINLNGAVNTLIGGSTAGAGNTISSNGNNGIVLNCPTLNGVVRCAVGNTISRNSIFSQPNNLGIRFNTVGGFFGNNNQAAPVISFVSVSGGGTIAQGSLTTGAANQNYTLEFFANDGCAANPQSEGKTYIGTYNVTTDPSGTVNFTTTALDPVAIGKVITATATHGTNGTSRFSTCAIASASTATISGRATDQNGVAISGVSVTLSGGQSGSATTDAQGNYSFPNLTANLSYAVTASLSGVTFYPASFTLTNLPADRTVNFTKAVARYTITDLGALSVNPVSLGWDVNNAGQATGWTAQTGTVNLRPYFYDNGALTSLTPLGTGVNALGIAINDAGRVVGYSELVPNGANLHGFFSDNGGVLKDIGTFGGANTQAWGVNDNGAVVGQSQLANGQTRPFIWRDTNNDGQWQLNEMLDLGPINGATFGRLFAINNQNVGVGNSTDPTTGFTLATFWKDDNGNGISDPGELRSLGNLGGNSANASGINDNTYVCGTSDISGLASNGRVMTRGFIWHDDNGNGVNDLGEMKNLGTLGGEFSSVLRINATNEIIGWSDAVGINTARAIRWKNNFMLDLNSAIPQNSGWVLTEARGISDNGKITGYGTINGAQHAFVLTPALAAQTVTFDPIANKTYGNAPFTLTATASSNLPVTFSVVSGPATVSGNTVTITGAGSVTLRATQAGDSTYDSATADQSFTVAPVLLRVIADSKTKVFGAPNPAFTVHYSGFVGTDNASSLGGSLSFTAPPDNSPVGSYSITPGGLTSNNYTFQYLPATLTVDQAASTTSSGNYTLTVPGVVNLSAQVTADAPSNLIVGQGTVTFVIRQGANTIGSVTSGPVSNGQATASLNIPSAGAYTVYASYSGTSNYFGSTGLASLTVGTANPIPTITGVTPDSTVKKPTETGQFTLIIDGNGFMATANGNPANSAVDWYDRTTGQHTNLSLTSITPSQIQAVVPFTLIRDGKTVEVTVVNAGPGGGASNVQPFFITDTTATVTGTETVIPDPSTGNASTTSVTPSGAVLSAEASSGGAGGTGTLTVAQYSGDPIGTNSSPSTSAFSTAEGSGYFDVYVSPGSSFTSLTLDYCNTGGTTLYWWDGSVWGLVSNQSYNPTTGCITVTVTTTSSPSIAQLTGTVFGVASGPSVSSISISPSATVALGSGAVTLNASIVDPNGSGPYTADINWGDGQTTTVANVTGSVLSATHGYTAAGTYTIAVKVTRGSSFGTSTFSPLVVFNPAAGSMNADGWFNAPLGSYPANPSFAGKIHFESNVKYAANATVPTGTAKVNLPGKDFVATSVNWLTISGSNLQLSGIGTINNVAGYRILLTGIDGKVDGKKLPDKIRIKIWNQATGAIVYDSQMDAADNAAPAIVLGGGNVNIKK